MNKITHVFQLKFIYYTVFLLTCSILSAQDTSLNKSCHLYTRYLPQFQKTVRKTQENQMINLNNTEELDMTTGFDNFTDIANLC